jgi:hypothetical protein
MSASDVVVSASTDNDTHQNNKYRNNPHQENDAHQNNKHRDSTHEDDAHQNNKYRDNTHEDDMHETDATNDTHQENDTHETNDQASNQASNQATKENEKAPAHKYAGLPTVASIEGKVAQFCKGWLANRKDSIRALGRKTFATNSTASPSPVAPLSPAASPSPAAHLSNVLAAFVTPALVCAVVKVVRKALDPVLPPGPMFVITDCKTARSDPGKGTFGLTAWGATFVAQPCKTVNEWWHEPTCPKLPKAQRTSMFLYAKYCNSDWVIAPVVALLLQNLLPWSIEQEGKEESKERESKEQKSKEQESKEQESKVEGKASVETATATNADSNESKNAGAEAEPRAEPRAETRAKAAVSVVEFPADPTLPVYQFVDKQGNKQMMRSKETDVFNCVRLGQHDDALEHTLDNARHHHHHPLPRFATVDVVRGFEIADTEQTNHKLVPVDVDLACFLLFRNAKARRCTDVFEAALDVCQKQVAALLATQFEAHLEAYLAGLQADVPRAPSNEVSEQISDQISDQVSDQVNDQASEQISDQVSDQVMTSVAGQDGR